MANSPIGTAPAGTAGLSRAAGWLALAYILALAALLLWRAIDTGEGEDLLWGPVGIAWMAAPVVAAAALAGASPTRPAAAAFLALETVMIVVDAWIYVELAYFKRDAFVGLALGALPVFQWFAIVAAFLFALACGWRMRPDFLRD